MNNLIKVVKSGRVVISIVKCRVLTNFHREICFRPQLKDFPCNFNVISIRNMSQKSITSFFKKTPKKVDEDKEKTPAEDAGSPTGSPVLKNSDTEISPARNGKEKRSSKRQRLDSSDSDSPSLKPTKQSTTPISSDKKKKSKRQRIESSGSESEQPAPEEKQPEIKLEKTVSPKTYASPKSKKVNSKAAKSPLVEKKNNKESKSKSPSPKKKTKVKEEKSVSEDISKKPKGLLGFVKKEKENDVSAKDEVKTENGNKKVPEEEYNPAKPKYHPIDDACWSKGEAVPYLALAKTLEAIEATSARLKIIEILANYFRSVIALTPEDLLPSVYMCLNQLAPAYHSVELGIAETYLMKAIGQCTGRSVAQVKAAARREGDLAGVAERARATQRTMFAPPPLLARKVFAALKEIAHITGQASVNKKIAKIQTLYTACRYCEAKYLIRSLEGKLRIGLAEQSVLHALALAVTLTPPAPAPASDNVLALDASKGLTPEQFKARVDEQALVIKTTYCECPNYELVIPALLQYGVAALREHCKLTPGIPLKPMLAHPTKGLHEIFNRFEKEEFTCEWKYDGERAQIHVPAADSADDTAEPKPDYSRAAIFSRNQENNTSKYPDILGRLPKLLKESVSSCVLDTEAVAYDTVNKKIMPFQVLSTRKRKDAQEAEIKVQVCVFVFDLLYLNGRALVREPLATRRRLLREHFNQHEGEWQLATSRDCSTTEEVQQFLEESIRGSCEGLMVKTLNGDSARYDIARRSHNWLKLKKDYLEGVGDTIDAVVIGAWWGRGKRAGLLGGFLLAARDPAADELQALCKLGTGFSDTDLAALTAALKEHVIDAPRTYYRFDASHAAEVWLEARCVWEVRCADLSLSPAHRAAIGLVDPDKGISLRFPRFVRVREDKTPEEATTAQQIAEMYLAQDQVKNQAPRNTNYDDFY